MMSITFNFSKELFLPQYNIVLWSLGVEVWFSLLFPFIVLLFYRIGMVRLLIYTLLFSLSIRLVGNYYAAFTIDNSFLNPLKDSVLGRLDDFVVGMCIAYLFAQGHCKALETQAVKLFLLGIVCFLVACTLSDNILLGYLPRIIVPFTNNIVHIGFFLIIIALLAMPIQQRIRWFFTNYAFQMFGMMCYSLYIWHGILTVFIQHDYSIPRLIGYFVLLLGLTLFSYRYIEFGHIRDTKGLFLLHR
jgi:peptidoglycan/LPS O-acetylase OafA/YrhL